MASTAILVISGHRCGSSAVAGVLHKLGVCMGKALGRPIPTHPGGHFEDRAFQALHKQMVPDWRVPRNSPGPRICKSLFANSKPSFVASTALRRSWAWSDDASETRRQ